MINNFEVFTKLVGKTIRSVKNISDYRQERFQLNFTDNTVAVLESNADGYDVGYEEIKVQVFEEK